MIPQDVVLSLVGIYLAFAIVVAAGRRAAGGVESFSLWLTLWGFWALVALPRWIELGGPYAILTGLAWAAVSALLVWIGIRFLQGRTESGLLWILGPVHALGLVVTWIGSTRKRKPISEELPAREEETDAEQDARESVVELGETTIEEIMIPRSEVAALEATARVRDWVARVEETGHRMIPVYREDMDEIIGTLDLRELLAQPDADAPVKNLVREVRFVPETMRCDDLLRDLIAAGERIAMVVDEFGGTAGLVTDQDLVEILLGEITRQNPFEGRIVQSRPGRFLADGHYRIDDFNEWSPLLLPEGNYETLAGFLLEQMGRIPPQGEHFALEGLGFEVTHATKRRIMKVQITFDPKVVEKFGPLSTEKPARANGA